MNYPQNRKTKTYLSGLFFFLTSAVIMVAVFQLDKVKQVISQATGRSAEIIIDTQLIAGPMNRSWQNLAQGGESHSWRMTQISNRVRALNPQYIRLDHIYDFYDIVQGSPGNITFNFSKLDLILNDILATGAKPYICLSYMPPVISKSDIVDAPQHWTDWQLTVQKTIEHISGTLQISDVYYEVWNEPDLFGNWNYYGSKNYLTLYTYSALAARDAEQNPNVTQFYLGGAGTTALYKNWFNALVKHTLNNKLKFDFFSWHHYDLDVDSFEKDLINIKAWIARYPHLINQLELHVTEWGLDSELNPAYDSTFGATHTIAGAITFNQLVDRAFIFEIQDGKDPNNQTYWGRWGLLTHQEFGSQPKPRYYSLLFLDKIGNQQLYLTGQGSWVKALAARNDRGNPEFIMVNYDQYFNHTELVPVTFINLSPGTYTLQLEYLDGKTQHISAIISEDKYRAEILMLANAIVYGELIKNN